MGRKSKEQIKKEKEVHWFVKKYLWNDENLEEFIQQLCPHDVGVIIKKAFEMGMGMTWEEDCIEEELQLSSSSVYDLVKLKEKKDAKDN